MTTTQIAEQIEESIGVKYDFHQLEDLLWVLTVNPYIMRELNRRHQDWRREMDELHQDQ